MEGDTQEAELALRDEHIKALQAEKERLQTEVKNWNITCDGQSKYTVELKDDIDNLRWMLNESREMVNSMKADFIRLHTMAVKWVDKDHHDWQELMTLRWGE